MSLDVNLLVTKPTTVYSANITHNLMPMAQAAGLYRLLWCPEVLCISTAGELIPALERGLVRLKSDPEKFRAFNSPNGWGKYEHFVSFVELYLEACRENPDARVSVST